MLAPASNGPLLLLVFFFFGPIKAQYESKNREQIAGTREKCLFCVGQLLVNILLALNEIT